MSIVFLNGKFLDSSEAKISVFDHGFLYGDGVYETLLVLQNNVIDFDSHFHRLQNSCSVLGLVFPDYCNTEEKFLGNTSLLLQKNPEILQKGRGRLRITLSRGENSFDFSSCSNATLLFSLSPLPPYPQEFFQKGVSLQTILLERSYPEVKSINFLASLLGRRELSKTGKYEAIFVTSEGFLREGTVSNIIAVSNAQKEFWLAPEKTVLAGTMQEKISEKLLANGFQKKSRNFSLAEISEKNMEVMISNSLFGAIPVSHIDEQKINTDFSVFTQYIGENFLENLSH